MDSSNRRQLPQRTLDVLFLLVLFAYCGWVLSLPLFPAQDSPMHLYIASVLAGLLSGSKVYSGYFFIRHLVSPYILNYYFLAFFGHFFSYLFADKLLVCAILLCSAFGFRFLALTLGPSGDIMSIFAVPLFLSWSLGTGFYSYCLSLGMAWFALGFWFRAQMEDRHRWRIAFVAIVLLMLVTHPLPVALVLVFAAFDIGWRIFEDCRQWEYKNVGVRAGLARSRLDALYLLPTSLLALFFVRHFYSDHQIAAANNNLRNDLPVAVKTVLGLHFVSFFSDVRLSQSFHGLHILQRPCLTVLFLFALIAACSGFAKRWKSCKSTNADIVLVTALIVLFALPFVPMQLNKVDGFAVRFYMVPWLALLAAASGYPRFSNRARLGLTCLACMFGFAILYLANVRISPVANRIAQMEIAPAGKNGQSGLGLILKKQPDADGLAFNPYFWSAARYFRRSRSVMLNSGWVYQDYLPVGSHFNAITDAWTTELQDRPWFVDRLLVNYQAERERLMPHVDVVVFLALPKGETVLDSIRAIDPHETARNWDCQDRDWYAVCNRAPEKH